MAFDIELTDDPCTSTTISITSQSSEFSFTSDHSDATDLVVSATSALSSCGSVVWNCRDECPAWFSLDSEGTFDFIISEGDFPVTQVESHAIILTATLEGYTTVNQETTITVV